MGRVGIGWIRLSQVEICWVRHFDFYAFCMRKGVKCQWDYPWFQQEKALCLLGFKTPICLHKGRWEHEQGHEHELEH